MFRTNESKFTNQFNFNRSRALCRKGALFCLLLLTLIGVIDCTKLKKRTEMAQLGQELQAVGQAKNTKMSILAQVKVKARAKAKKVKTGAVGSAPVKMLAQVGSKSTKKFKFDKLLEKNVRLRKLTFFSLAALISIVFWGFIVQCALTESKKAMIEIMVMEKEDTLSNIDKLLYMSRMINKKKKRLGGSTGPVSKPL